MSELATRSITGFFIVAVTLAAVWFSPYSFLALLCLIHGFGWYEFLKLNKTGFSPALVLMIPFILTCWLAIFGYMTIAGMNQSLPFVSLPVLLASLVCVILFQRIPADQISLGGRTLFSGSAYLTLSLGMGCLLFFAGEHYKYLMLIAIILIWTNDVGAYLVGSKWGKRKIAPGLSPGKSLEGTAGGFFISLLVAVGLSRIWPDINSHYSWFLGLTIPFFALAGDLFESSLKRTAGVKDSGSILPGHGGFLDRYDSFLFVLPLTALAYFIFTP